jgi:molybdate transport system substrate-binding protein
MVSHPSPPDLPSGVRASEIRILSSNILRGVLQEIGAEFESAARRKLIVTYGPPAQIRASLLRGEPADVVLVGRPGIEALDEHGLIANGSRIDVATNRIGVAMRAGSPKPDIGSVEAFRRMLIAAKSIVYTDPAKGGTSGIQFARVLDRLGIAEQVRAKSILNDGSLSAELVARGEAEVAIQHVSEIVQVKGIELIGPLPEELQEITIVAAAIVKTADHPSDAKAFIDFLISPAVAKVIRARGMEPSR